MTLLTLLHPERPKLYTILAFLGAIGLKHRFLVKAGAPIAKSVKRWPTDPAVPGLSHSRGEISST